MRPPIVDCATAGVDELVDRGEELRYLLALGDQIEEVDGQPFLVGRGHLEQVGEQSRFLARQFAAFVAENRLTQLGWGVFEQPAPRSEAEEIAEPGCDLLVLVLIAQVVERCLDGVAIIGARGIDDRSEQAALFRASGEEIGDPAERFILRRDLLLHVPLMRGRERRIAGLQTTANGLPVERSARLHRPALANGVHLPRLGGVLDELAFGQRDQDTRQFQDRGKIGRGQGEIAALIVVTESEVETRAFLDRPYRAGDGIDDDGGVGTLKTIGRGDDRLPHRVAPFRRVVAAGIRSLPELLCEVVLDRMNDHLAIVVRDDIVTERRQPSLKIIAICDVPVVRAVNMRLASHLVRLRVEIIDRAEGRPAHLAAHDRSRETDDPELLDHDRRCSDTLPQNDLLAFALKCGTRRVVASILESLEQFCRNCSEVVSVMLAGEAEYAAHEWVPPGVNGARGESVRTANEIIRDVGMGEFRGSGVQRFRSAAPRRRRDTT